MTKREEVARALAAAIDPAAFEDTLAARMPNYGPRWQQAAIEDAQAALERLEASGFTVVPVKEASE